MFWYGKEILVSFHRFVGANAEGAADRHTELLHSEVTFIKYG
jgi:hypothetical protein